MPEVEETDSGPVVRHKLHSGQRAAIFSHARFNVIVAGRRYGKSEAAVWWALLGAMTDRQAQHDPAITWWVEPTFPLCRPIWRKFLRLAPPGWITATHGSEASPDFLELGGARIEFKSAEHPERLVAEGLRRVVIDECGMIKEAVWTESLRPALIDYAAPAMFVGTPKGRNWFHRLYVRGNDPEDRTVASFGGPSWQNPFIERTEIDELARDMPERLHRQEILAEFLDDEGAVFRGHRKLVGPYSKEPTAVLGVDLARTQDFTVLHGLDAAGRTTHWERFNQVSWPLQKGRIRAVAAKDNPFILIDSTGVGDAPCQDLQAAGLKVEGFKFTNASKQQLVEGLAIEIEQSAAAVDAGEEPGLALPDEPVLLNELDVFEFTTTAGGLVRYGAPEGSHDDCVIALALARRALRTPRVLTITAY